MTRDNYDFAIRIAVDLEPDLVATRIGSIRHQLFASKSYLAKHGNPKQLNDLKQHDLLGFGGTRRAKWSFIDTMGKRVSIEFQPTLNSNNGSFLLEAVKKGLGISNMPDFISQQAKVEGEIIPVLTDLRSPEFGIYIVRSENRRLNRRMRLFAEEMKVACS